MVLFPGCGQDGFEDVVVAVIGGAEVLHDGVAIELGVNRGEGAAVETGVVLLLAMIGQRLAGDLAASDAATVGEGCEEQRIDASEFLEVVENRLDAFIDERDGSYLDADHLFR